MSFANALQRLRRSCDANDPSQRGYQRTDALVPRRDLRELLFQFDRLDNEARARHKKEHPELYPPEPQTGETIDEAGVTALASAMSYKLSIKRSEGRGGWHDPKQCTVELLATMLVDHVLKGDPVDIANFCMMIYNRRPQGNVIGEALERKLRIPANVEVSAEMERAGLLALDKNKDDVAGALRAMLLAMKPRTLTRL